MISNPQLQRLARHAIWIGGGAAALWLLTLGFPDEASALLVILVTSGIFLGLYRHFADEKGFITKLFLAGLAIRLLFGMFVHVYDLRRFFGGDAVSYDINGQVLIDYWSGLISSSDTGYSFASSTARPGWGMNYLVAGIYMITGRNILAAQSFCAVVGAATAPMVYFCSLKLFNNRNVGRTAAWAIAFFPAFVIWSAQLLKDGLITFLLVLAMTMVLQLQQRLNYAAIGLIVLSLFGILSLRFYIFYMVAIAIAGSFVIGLSQKSSSILTRVVVLVFIGFALTYLGVIRNATANFETYGDLERIQISRLDLARSAESGFADEVDVSTTEGAISAIPLGFAVLMLAPFPWQVTSLRQAIAIPEVFVWWAMIPLMISGIAYSIRHRLRSTFPILFFSLTLTLAYSIFQGNVGTAYRQRTQIQVFLFIFIAVGWELWKERREDRKMENLMKQRRFAERLEAGSQRV